MTIETKIIYVVTSGEYSDYSIDACGKPISYKVSMVHFIREDDEQIMELDIHFHPKCWKDIQKTFFKEKDKCQ